jgi:ribosome biogenesis GTPase
VLTVLTPTGERVPCLARGKGKGAVVGDFVHYVPTPPDELSSGNIMSIAPRRNFLARADEHARRPQVIAANLDRLVVVMAVQPPARSGLIDRLLVAAHAQGIPGCVVLNKTDLLDEISTEEMDEVLEPYPDLGYPVYRVSASTGDGMAASPPSSPPAPRSSWATRVWARRVCSTPCVPAWASGSRP